LTSVNIHVDLARHRPIDVLPDRSCASLAAWLRAHPGFATLARDRASVYAEGARDGAPAAVPVADRWPLVADRWPLVANLADVLEAVLRAKPSCARRGPPSRRRRARSRREPAVTIAPAPRPTSWTKGSGATPGRSTGGTA
jgi:transposase